MTHIAPRPYQDEALAAAWLAVHEGAKSVLIEMATGLGKSYVAAWFVQQWLKKHPGKRVLFVVDRVDAVNQGRKHFETVLGITRDAPSNPASMGTLHGELWDGIDAQILFSTFDSMGIWWDTFQVDKFGLVVVDECHHAPANSYAAVISRFKEADALIFAMTGTKERLDGKSVTDLFGDPVYTYSLLQALEDDKWLASVQYKLFVDNINMRALRRLIKAHNGGEVRVTRARINRTIFLDSELEQVVKTVRDHQEGDTRTIIFTRNIEHSLVVAAEMPEAMVYHSMQPKRKGVKTTLELFREGTCKTLIVVDKVNEAVDIPEADLLVFYRATNAKRIWLQQLGRGLRRTESKLWVTVLDFVCNCDRIAWVEEMARGLRDYKGPGEWEDPLTVGSKEFQILFSKEMVDLVRLLRRIDEGPYESWEEAAKAARALNIRTSDQYTNGAYKQDTRLPSSPQMVYQKVWKKNGGWRGFLSKEWLSHYPTWEEAAQAARAFGIKSGVQYLALRKKDARLPATPYCVYSDVWEKKGGWPGFLGTSTKVPRRREDLYPTWEEAAKAARALGATSEGTYQQLYDSDPRLACNPNTIYTAVWKKNGGWYGFVNKKKRADYYSTWEEAAKAARALGFRTSMQYRAAYTVDEHLPGKPEVIYRSVWKQNGGWRGFLGTLKKN